MRNQRRVNQMRYRWGVAAGEVGAEVGEWFAAIEELATHRKRQREKEGEGDREQKRQ